MKKTCRGGGGGVGFKSREVGGHFCQRKLTLWKLQPDIYGGGTSEEHRGLARKKNNPASKKDRTPDCVRRGGTGYIIVLLLGRGRSEDESAMCAEVSLPGN